MLVNQISIENFRNFTRLESQFSTTINVFLGMNGSGKSNLLEALFVLCLGKSHRGSADSALVRHGTEAYRIEGTVTANGRSYNPAIAFGANGRRKQTIDKVTARAAELYELFCGVAISPEDSRLLSEGPAIRRTFLDIHIAQLQNDYLELLSNYQRTIAQKNACLKRMEDPEPFDVLLVRTGSQIMARRGLFIDQIQPMSAQKYSALSGGDALDICYRPSAANWHVGATADDMHNQFNQKLTTSREREKIMQVALVGPHRDDVDIEIGGQAARTFASQGEWRTAAVALKLAVYDLLKIARGTPPLLLLDEVFAELDNSRSAALIDAFADFGQLFLTTAVEPPEQLLSSARKFRLDHGQLVEVSL